MSNALDELRQLLRMTSREALPDPATAHEVNRKAVEGLCAQIGAWLDPLFDSGDATRHLNPAKQTRDSHCLSAESDYTSIHFLDRAHDAQTHPTLGTVRIASRGESLDPRGSKFFDARARMHHMGREAHLARKLSDGLWLVRYDGKTVEFSEKALMEALKYLLGLEVKP